MTPTAPGKELAGRDRNCLERARANGYLNAACRAGPPITRAHSFWCWRLRVPLIWFERKSPRSKYGRLHLDLFTTTHALTEQGQAEMTDLIRRLHLPGRVAISPEDGHWEDIPQRRLEELARMVLRVATRLGNYEMRQRGSPAEKERVRNVLPWRRSA
jgi:hypothetical protein